MEEETGKIDKNTREKTEQFSTDSRRKKKKKLCRVGNRFACDQQEHLKVKSKGKEDKAVLEGILFGKKDLELTDGKNDCIDTHHGIKESRRLQIRRDSRFSKEKKIRQNFSPLSVEMM